MDGSICENSYIDGDSTDSAKLRLFCLSRGDIIGLLLIAEAGLISILAVAYVFWIISRNIIRSFRLTKEQRQPLLAAPIDVLMVSLLMADFLQGLGAALDIKWISQGKVEVGQYCTAQGVIQQLGETGGALSTLMIAIYTFVGIWWRKGLKKKGVLVASCFVAMIWMFVALITLLGNLKVGMKDGLSYELPTPYWCWINEHYLELRLFGEYLWFWVTLAVSILTYLLLYLWSRGIIVREDEDPWWKFKVHKRNLNNGDARKGIPSLLAYPFVYCILILPLSVVRWIQFSKDDTHGRPLPAAATLAVDAVFCLSGFSNVILLLVTRPNTALFRKGDWSIHRPFWATNEDGLPDVSSTGSVTNELQHYDSEVATEVSRKPGEDIGLGKLPSL